MPPHLHPRSNATSSLFAGTLLASFLVVGVPHILPCPAPRVRLADAQRAKQQQQDPTSLSKAQVQIQSATDGQLDASSPMAGVSDMNQLQSEYEAERARMLKRECPVPKPGVLAESILSIGCGSGKR